MFVDQFYGGALEAKDASPIHVRGGESLGGIDFRLNSEPGVQVRGRVTGVPEEVVPPVTPSAPSPGPGMPVVLANRFQPGPAIQIMIGPADAGAQRWSSGTSAQGPEHRFQTPEIPAGRYRIEATLRSGNKSYGAFQTLDLHAGSGEIVLALEPAKDIRGTVRVEGQAVTRPSSSALRVQLGRPGGAAGNISAQVGADGRFLLEQVPSGDWQLAVTPVPPGFLKSAQLGEKDVLFTPFDVGAAGNASLNIVVSMSTATVEGEVDAGSSDSKRAGIVLAPVAGPYHDLTRFYYGVAADDNGKFKLEGIAPGKYKIFALEKMAAANFRNPEAIDQLYELGEAIELPEGATVQAQPKLIPLDVAQKVLP
jgi:hypothetical protein